MTARMILGKVGTVNTIGQSKNAGMIINLMKTGMVSIVMEISYGYSTSRAPRHRCPLLSVDATAHARVPYGL